MQSAGLRISVAVLSKNQWPCKISRYYSFASGGNQYEHSIKPAFAKFIDELVKAGRFSSPTEALEAGVARLMVDSEPDVLDETDVADIQRSLDEMHRGDVIDSKALHARLRKL